MFIKLVEYKLVLIIVFLFQSFMYCTVPSKFIITSVMIRRNNEDDFFHCFLGITVCKVKFITYFQWMDLWSLDRAPKLVLLDIGLNQQKLPQFQLHALLQPKYISSLFQLYSFSSILYFNLNIFHPCFNFIVLAPCFIST